MEMPPSPTSAEYDAFVANEAAHRSLSSAIVSRHGLEGTWQRADSGTMVVYLSTRRVLKLYPEFEWPTFDIEASCLERLDGRLSIPTPCVEHRGTIGGFKYIVMSRLLGTPIDTCWAAMDGPTRMAFAHCLGEAVRQMHEVSTADLPALESDFPVFRRQQRARCLEQEVAAGLSEPWQARLSAYLEALDDIAEPVVANALLHTELGPGHVLWDGRAIGGLFDFGDAMLGEAEYDFGAVGLFVTSGDPRALGAFFEAYGYSRPSLDGMLQRRMFRHALLHRYGTLAWYLERLQPAVDSMEALEQLWFGLGAA